MDLKNWGWNLAAHSKCFPKLTDFLKIDENLTEIWQFENCCQIYENMQPCPPLKKGRKGENQANFEIVISQSNFLQFTPTIAVNI